MTTTTMGAQGRTGLRLEPRRTPASRKAIAVAITAFLVAAVLV